MYLSKFSIYSTLHNKEELRKINKFKVGQAFPFKFAVSRKNKNFTKVECKYYHDLLI